MAPRIILGIDPGSRITGYGLIAASGSERQFIACGSIRVNSDDMSARLWQIHQALDKIIQDYRPVVAAMETVFMHKNPASALKLGQARGAAIVVVASHGLDLCEYSPRQIKQAVTGNGNADKTQVDKMVKLLLSLNRDQSLQADAADALAVAICYANSHSRVGIY